MIELSAQIQLAEDSYFTNLDASQEGFSPINVSADINDIANKVSKGGNPFLLGISKFSDKATYVDDKLDFYISDNYMSDEEYLTISFDGNNLKYAIFYFDTVNNEYPQYINYANVNGGYTTYENNSPVTVIDLGEVANKSINLYRWSNPNYPIRIQGITTVVDIGKDNLTSINFSGQDRSDTNLPSWGIKSNSGKIEFKNNSGELFKTLKSNSTIYNCNINIYINTKNSNQQIGSFYIESCENSNDFSRCSLQFKDILPNWMEEKLPIKYAKSQELAYTLASNLGLKFADSKTLEYLLSIPFVFAYYEEGSKWNVATKLCEATGCYIYCNKKGEPTIKYDGAT